MSDTIIIAVVTALGTIGGQWVISKAQHDKDKAVMEEKLEGIKSRLDTHNHYAEKIGELAENMNDIKIGMAEMKKDIEYLRKGTDI